MEIIETKKKPMPMSQQGIADIIKEVKPKQILTVDCEGMETFSFQVSSKEHNEVGFFNGNTIYLSTSGWRCAFSGHKAGAVRVNRIKIA